MAPGIHFGSSSTAPQTPRDSLPSIGTACKQIVMSVAGPACLCEMTYPCSFFLRVELAKLRVEVVVIRNQHDIVPDSIPTLLVWSQERFHGRDGTEQSVLRDEWQKRDTLPCHLLSIHIDFEVGRIEVDDRRVFLDHQLLVWLRQVLFTDGPVLAKISEAISSDSRGWLT